MAEAVSRAISRRRNRGRYREILSARPPRNAERNESRRGDGRFARVDSARDQGVAAAMPRSEGILVTPARLAAGATPAPSIHTTRNAAAAFREYFGRERAGEDDGHRVSF